MLSAIRLRPDVRLTDLTPEHADAMYRWVSDPEIGRHVGLRSEPSLEKTYAWIEAAAVDPTVRPLAILHGERHVGNIVLDRIDRHVDSARLSVYIGEPASRSGGVGTSALVLALREGFEVLGLNKVWLTVHPWNAAALKVYTRVGFLLEGVLRDEFRLDGRLVPLNYLGLLRDEFRRLVIESPSH